MARRKHFGRKRGQKARRESLPLRQGMFRLVILAVGALVLQLGLPLSAQAQSCPSEAPLYCSNCGGYCCDNAHPYCTDDCMCSSSSGGGGGCPAEAPLYCANCGGYCCDSGHPYCTDDCMCSSSPSDSSDGGGCPADAPLFCSNCGGYCCDNDHPYCTDDCNCSSSGGDGTIGNGPDENGYICQGFSVPDHTDYRCNDIEICCTTSDCYYEADGYTFQCNGLECTAAAEDLVDYCMDSGGGTGDWDNDNDDYDDDDDSGDSSRCQAAPSLGRVQFSLLTLVLSR